LRQFLRIIFLLGIATAQLIAQESAAVRFVRNQGQWEAAIRYRADILGGYLLLKNNALYYFFLTNNRSNHHTPKEILSMPAVLPTTSCTGTAVLLEKMGL